MSIDSSEQSPLLDPNEARILGSLIEKEATTPDVYPLTLNAVVLACNQKTAREPLLQLEPGAVGHALRQLEARGWVKSQYGSRADRYEHRTEAKLSLTRPQAALLALLMLRGPQTVHELLARSERLARFDDADAVQHALERLAQREPALVTVLPRQSGQREERYAHLLCGAPVLPVATVTATATELVATTPSAPAAGLQTRVEALEARVAALEAQLRRLHREDAGEDDSGSDVY